ncbi:MAG TPA: GNAT family N-acetyltransferase [Candidatus Polarisedimenticolaceae bacterium]|nr:GNAT family N-acetyltransferase [Candidatus Polarisedimenticolaceae bacterium]
MRTDVHGEKVITAEQAARLVKPGDHVFVGTACAAPRTILSALEALDPPPPGVTLHHFLTTGVYEAGASPGGTRYVHRALFIGTDMKPLVPGGKADYVPIRLLEVPRLLESRRLVHDVAFIQVSEPDGNGFVSLGISVDITMAVVRHARMVVAEVNPHMPWTHGDTFVHLSDIAHLVPVDHALPTFAHAVADDIAHQIARYIAGVIEDGSTLQIGLGRIPNQALRYLADRRDLGIHSDVITDGVAELIRAGVVTGARKTVHRRQVVASYCLGSQELYGLVDRNPAFLFQPVEEVCNPAVIAAQNRMVSMTQAFAIDLTGQTSIDQFQGEFYGGVSTQPDFMRGASLARDGKPIICMASTTDDGRTSRIRPLLGEGDGVGIPRSDVHYVITEYGIAYLFGKSIQERAMALTEIAHPAFRPWLLEEGKRLGYLTAKQRPVHAPRYEIGEERSVTLEGGRAVLLRPARTIDARALQGLFHRLPPEDVYTRFFRRLKSLSIEEAENLCNVDQESEVAFVAVAGPRENETVVGSACYFVNHTSNMAETAFMIDPEWQGVGLGSALQTRMKEHALARGLRGFIAEVLATNEKMIRLARAASDDVRIEGDGSTCRISMLFRSP